MPSPRTEGYLLVSSAHPGFIPSRCLLLFVPDDGPWAYLCIGLFCFVVFPSISAWILAPVPSGFARHYLAAVGYCNGPWHCFCCAHWFSVLIVSLTSSTPARFLPHALGLFLFDLTSLSTPVRFSFRVLGPALFVLFLVMKWWEHLPSELVAPPSYSPTAPSEVVWFPSCLMLRLSDFVSLHNYSCFMTIKVFIVA